MNGKQLKNSILQWAIQGKLVPQDPNDEPASVLLGRIRAEKARLVKEGKIKKDKNESIIFKGDDNSYYEKFADGKVVCIDDEIPFEIPAGWEWCRLGSILSIVSDGTHKTPNYVEHGIPFLSVQNISSGELDLSKIKYITPEEHQQLISRVHPMPGDILVCRIGTLGKAIKITWDFEFSIFVSLGLLRPVLAELADYIVSYINSPWGNRWIQENKVGGGTHTYKINLGDFPNMMICIPPYQEQVRIKERINLFEPSLKSYTKAQQQLDELNATINDTLKKSILQEAIKGKLVPQNPEDEPAEKLLKRIDAEKQRLVKEGKLKAKDAITSVIFKGEDNKYYEKIGGQTTEITAEIPYDIPATWCWCRLQNIVNIKDADRRPVSKEERIAGIYPYYGANGILDYVNKYIFDGTYILVGEDGSVMNKNGNPIVNRAIGKIWVNNHAHILEEYGKLGYFDFLYYALQCADISGYVHGFMPKYSQGDLRKTLIAIPPIKEQIRIVQTILKTTPLL